MSNHEFDVGAMPLPVKTLGWDLEVRRLHAFDRAWDRLRDQLSAKAEAAVSPDEPTMVHRSSEGPA